MACCVFMGVLNSTLQLFNAPKVNWGTVHVVMWLFARMLFYGMWIVHTLRRPVCALCIHIEVRSIEQCIIALPQRTLYYPKYSNVSFRTRITLHGLGHTQKQKTYESSPSHSNTSASTGIEHAENVAMPSMIWLTLPIIFLMFWFSANIQVDMVL